ncbi:hypothetical protein COV18_06290 [Candidatus Woesearchaeota archaeon CG10_big_fil_rev_8_21_14_0_10_37_12]|nr:MAG: hypothetical protein COV18_06290 [Candidatus Woesearchaeota archaeon CG10_big_fil_rev_8_21_14_0_10_37_12]
MVNLSELITAYETAKKEGDTQREAELFEQITAKNGSFGYTLAKYEKREDLLPAARQAFAKQEPENAYTTGHRRRDETLTELARNKLKESGQLETEIRKFFEKDPAFAYIESLHINDGFLQQEARNTYAEKTPAMAYRTAKDLRDNLLLETAKEKLLLDPDKAYNETEYVDIVEPEFGQTIRQAYAAEKPISAFEAAYQREPQDTVLMKLAEQASPNEVAKSREAFERAASESEDRPQKIGLKTARKLREDYRREHGEEPGGPPKNQ